MRMPLSAVLIGVAVAVLGAAGLVRGAVPQSVSVGVGTTPAGSPIVVSNAYVREPVPPTDTAAAYFTVYNTAGAPDLLQSVVSGAGASSVLHTIVNGQMTVSATGTEIPAHGSLVLSPGKGHVMIEQIYGQLRPGQRVSLELNFKNAGPIVVSAPVISTFSPAPTGTPPSGSATPPSSPAPSGSGATQ